VKAESWHLHEMTLAFSDATYRITEVESSVLAREDVPSDVLARLESPHHGSIPLAESPAVAGPAVPPVDWNDLEMSVRSDLHRIGADLGEAIEIVPQPPDRLRVEVSQVSPAIRENLIALLQNKPGVELEFKPLGSGAGPRVMRVIPQSGGSGVAVSSRLAEFFGSTEAQENYSQSVLETSNTALAHLYALRELAGRWTVDQEKSLSAGAIATLHAMVQDHARAIREASSGLQKQLTPLLEHFGPPLPEAAPTQSRTSWREASQTALEAARRLDQTLRSLLTNSDSPLSIDQALPRIRQGLGDLHAAVLEP
jgi:hypothetical protein